MGDNVMPIRKIYNTIYTSGYFSVKHSVDLMKSITSGNRVSRFNTWKPYNSSSTNLYINSNGNSSLIFESTDKSKAEKESAFVPQRLYHQIKQMLNVGYEWLTSKDYSSLYTHDSNGLVTGIGDMYIHIPMISLMNGNSISIIPSVVVDYDGVQYEGIEMRGTSDTIGLLTAQEYVNMTLQVVGYINNMYAADMTMMNMSILYMIGQQMGLPL